MITYYELGADKQLNEIVFAGSHDAGIMLGGDNVRTQHLDIGDQARAGVRLFDLRIAAASSNGDFNGEKSVALHAFHADGKLMTNESKTRHLEDVGRVVKLTRTALKRGGEFGLALSDMLTDARNFVMSDKGSTEFLILKFDKCQNWPLIAEACVTMLGDQLYTGGGNLNTTKLKKLAGKVVVLFSPKGLGELGSPKVLKTYGKYIGLEDGILGFRNLYDKEHGSSGYNWSYPGLQYYGKGGTSVMKPRKKLGQNEHKQGKLLGGGQMLGNPDVMGMMYWTTTGIFESIKTRNDKMWEAPNVTRLREMWTGGLREFVDESNPYLPPPRSHALASQRKLYMPNIVMIDFADKPKCRQIRALNALCATDLVALEGGI